jgi:tRNA (cytidine/uridine-2'-O-)-methyltransferase
VHPGWEAFLTAVPSSRRFAFSAKAANRYDQVEYQAGDVLVFGPETSGLPEGVRASFEARRRLRLPMVPASRSLNLSNAVAAVVYEAWRQNGFMGASGS